MSLVRTAYVVFTLTSLQNLEALPQPVAIPSQIQTPVQAQSLNVNKQPEQQQAAGCPHHQHAPVAPAVFAAAPPVFQAPFLNPVGFPASAPQLPSPFLFPQQQPNVYQLMQLQQQQAAAAAAAAAWRNYQQPALYNPGLYRGGFYPPYGVARFYGDDDDEDSYYGPARRRGRNFRGSSPCSKKDAAAAAPKFPPHTLQFVRGEHSSVEDMIKEFKEGNLFNEVSAKDREFIINDYKKANWVEPREGEARGGGSDSSSTTSSSTGE